VASTIISISGSVCFGLLILGLVVCTIVHNIHQHRDGGPLQCWCCCWWTPTDEREKTRYVEVDRTRGGGQGSMFTGVCIAH
jgi:hypothetical protein